MSVAAAFVGPVSFFVIFGVMSLWDTYDLTGAMQHLFNSPETYLVLFFFATGYMLVDYGMVSANVEITSWMLRQKEISAYKARKAAQQDETLTRRKVTGFLSKSLIIS